MLSLIKRKEKKNNYSTIIRKGIYINIIRNPDILSFWDN